MDTVSQYDRMRREKEGWAGSHGKGRHMGQSGRSRKKYHYFRKGDPLSLCGCIRLVSRFRFLDAWVEASGKRCTHCLRLLSTYQDVQNMIRYGDNLGAEEW